MQLSGVKTKIMTNNESFTNGMQVTDHPVEDVDSFK